MDTYDEYEYDSDCQEEEYYQTVAGGEYAEEKMLDDLDRAADMRAEMR